MGVSGQRHAPAALQPQGKNPWYPLYMMQGGPQSRSRHRCYRKNPFASAGDRTSIARSSNSYDWATRLTSSNKSSEFHLWRGGSSLGQAFCTIFPHGTLPWNMYALSLPTQSFPLPTCRFISSQINWGIEPCECLVSPISNTVRRSETRADQDLRITVYVTGISSAQNEIRGR
jgi:hypothetical protein